MRNTFKPEIALPQPFVPANRRIDTVVDSISEARRVDSSFFKAHPKRRCYMRMRLACETPQYLGIPQLLGMPDVWVHVYRSSWGAHKVEPVWLGNRFWGEPSSDAEVYEVVAECAKTYGLDEAALERSIAAFTEYQAEKNGTVE
jgi:hypothetical protein